MWGGVAHADEPAPDERMWDGYLYRDPQGRIQVGWAVIAMGVIAQPAHVVGEPLAARLAPLMSEQIEVPHHHPELVEAGWLGNETFIPMTGVAAPTDDANAFEALYRPLARELRAASRPR